QVKSDADDLDGESGKATENEIVRPPNFFLYLTSKGYTRLGLEYYTPFDDGGIFEKGLSRSLSSLLNPKSDPRFPDDWDLHAMLLIASDRENFSDVPANLVNLASSNLPWLEVTVQDGLLKKEEMHIWNDAKGAVEEKDVIVDWFGFRDGISQPLFFPDLQGKKEDKYKEDDLASLRVVLTKDRGGRELYSAGSFLAYLKIEQDIDAFKKMEDIIAAHTSVFGLEALIARKKIEIAVKASEIEKVIDIDNVAVDRLADNIENILPDLSRRLNPLSKKVREICTGSNIAGIISQNEIGRLVSIRPEKKDDLLKDILIKIRKVKKENGKSEVDFNSIIKEFNNKIEFLKSEAEIAFLNTRVIDNMIKSITNGSTIDKVAREQLHEAFDNVFSVNPIAKRKLIESLSTSNLSLLEVEEVDHIIRDKVRIAEAYIMGRFKDGTPLTESDRPNRDKTPADENFSYRKKLLSKDGSNDDDLKAIRCPFATHARKANPRDDRQRRMIARRGVLYEDKTPDGKTSGRGSLFMSFQANLAEQFEYIIRHWINNVNYDQQLTGVDIMAGTGINRAFSRWYFPVNWDNDDPDAKVLLTPNELDPCIRYLEGEYFYAPSISFLKNIKHLSTFSSNKTTKGPSQPPSPFKTKQVFDGYPVKPIKLLRGI
ncbi:MAG TPA: Dyp-type peroxidase, partial [Saprospiraceae bacterium]|nr:Dyp-type peroxidase [Saprospiraceae bacterium]